MPRVIADGHDLRPKMVKSQGSAEDHDWASAAAMSVLAWACSRVLTLLC